MKPIQKIIAYFGISLASAFIFAIAWVIIMTFTLPETDMAYGQTPFEDPIVFPIMSAFAIVSGLIAWPFYTYLGWNASPARVACLAGLITLAFILIATPYNAGIGWFGSYFVLLIALVGCRLEMKGPPRISHPPHDSPTEGSPSGEP